jgi:hypothetical protein
MLGAAFLVERRSMSGIRTQRQPTLRHKHPFTIVAMALASITAGCASVGVVPSADSMKETAKALAVGESPYLAAGWNPTAPRWRWS